MHDMALDADFEGRAMRALAKLGIDGSVHEVDDVGGLQEPVGEADK